MSLIRRATVAIAAGATIMAVAASAASANTVTMHFFSKQVYTRVTDAAGKPVASNAGLAPGDRLSAASNDYAGNHKQHARKATASDHIVCTITGPATALCDGTLSIGGAMILGDDFTLNFTAKTTTVKITGGTGRYRHAHGTIVVKQLSSNGTNSDVTAKITT